MPFYFKLTIRLSVFNPEGSLIAAHTMSFSKLNMRDLSPYMKRKVKTLKDYLDLGLKKVRAHRGRNLIKVHFENPLLLRGDLDIRRVNNLEMQMPIADFVGFLKDDDPDTDASFYLDVVCAKKTV